MAQCYSGLHFVLERYRSFHFPRLPSRELATNKLLLIKLLSSDIFTELEASPPSDTVLSLINNSTHGRAINSDTSSSAVSQNSLVEPYLANVVWLRDHLNKVHFL
jgi:hypothetical protein